MLGEALRLLRVFNDMKASELAVELDISASYLSEIENKKKTPTIDLINRYAKVFDTKPSAILFFAEEIDAELFKHKQSSSKKQKVKINQFIRTTLIKILQSIESAKPQNATITKV